MYSLNIFTDFCNWWWLAWLLPFILGLVLGYAIWAKWARRTREMEDELATFKNKYYKQGKELKTLEDTIRRLENK